MKNQSSHSSIVDLNAISSETASTGLFSDDVSNEYLLFPYVFSLLNIAIVAFGIYAIVKAVREAQASEAKNPDYKRPATSMTSDTGSVSGNVSSRPK